MSNHKQKPDPRVLAAIVAVHLAITTLTWRSISRRPAELVRGPKTLWRTLSGLNTIGSVGYLLIGRRRSTQA